MGKLVWFRNDLRTENNRLLDKLINKPEASAVIIEEPIPYESIDDFVLYNKLKLDHRLTSIEQFKEDLSKLGVTVEVLRGKPSEVLPEYCEKNNIDRVYTSKIFDNEEIKKSNKLESILAKNNVFVDFIYNNTWIPVDELPFPLRKVPQKFKAFLKEIKGLEDHFYDRDSPVVDHEKDYIEQLITNIEENNTYELKKYVNSPNNNFFKFLPELTLGKVSSPALLDWVTKNYAGHPKKNKILKTFKEQLLMYDHFKLMYISDPEFDLEKPAINKEPDIKAFQKWVRGETRSPLINAIMKKLSTASELSLTSKRLAIDYYNHVLGLPTFWGYWYFKRQLMEYSGEINSFLWKDSLSKEFDKNELHTKICELSARLDPKNDFTSYWSSL